MMRSGESARAAEADRRFWIGLARAFGGAVFFSLPLLMTMEMWWLGFYMDRLRLTLLMVVLFPLLVALDHYSGFKETDSWGEDVIDALVAYGVGLVASAAILGMLGILHASMPLSEAVGKTALQAVPASFGAVLASSQLGGEGDADRQRESAGYASELLFLAAGGLFLAFNLAPTEEMVLIAYKMTDWHGLLLIGATLAMMHAFVYGVGFGGSHEPPEGVSAWGAFMRFTVVGYALALLVSAYVLWTFGRFDGQSLQSAVGVTVVLAFPAGLGAAAARLIL